MTKNWDYAARIVWSMLVERAGQHDKITYGEIAPAIQTNPLNVRHALGRIQEFCMMSGLPPLTAIVVNTDGLPGTGFIAWDIDDLPTAENLVWNYNWDKVRNPYSEFGPTDTIEKFAEEVTAAPNKAEDVFVKVRARGVAQLVFRRALLKAYRNQCAFCGLTFDEALEGCHIVSWNECSKGQRIDPRNGLLLCSCHHRLFDAALLTVSQSFKIVYADMEMKDVPYSEIDKTISINLHGRDIFLPKDKALWPSRSLLAARHKKQEWDNLS